MIAVASKALDAADVISLGLSSDWWMVIGLSAFFLAVAVMIYRYRSEASPSEGVEPASAIGHIPLPGRITERMGTDAPNCELDHTTEEQSHLLGWAHTQALHEVERTNEYVKVETIINLMGIYAQNDPVFLVYFKVSSSAMRRVIVGAEVKGSISSGQRLGAVPNRIIGKDGRDEILSLDRGQTGMFVLEQHITIPQRDSWLRSYLQRDVSRSEIEFQFNKLFVSVQLANQYEAGIDQEGWLQKQSSPSAELLRTIEWDGSIWQKIADGEPE